MGGKVSCGELSWCGELRSGVEWSEVGRVRKLSLCLRTMEHHAYYSMDGMNLDTWGGLLCGALHGTLVAPLCAVPSDPGWW